MEAGVFATHTGFTVEAFPECIGIIPNNVLNLGVIESIEESFLANIVDCVEKIGNTRGGVESNVKLGGYGGILASDLNISGSNHSSLSFIEWIHETN